MGTWVKETDKKPQFDKTVVCWCQIYGLYLGRYIHIGFGYGNWNNGRDTGVLPPIYWMELPEPPMGI